MILLSFRIRRPHAIGSITAGRSDVTFHTWCNLETDFVQVLSPKEERTQEAMEAIVRRFGPNIVPAAPAGDRTAAALIPCPANPTTSVSVTVERHGGLVQPPIVSADGWDQFRAILFDDDAAADLLAAVARLGECELVSKRPLKHLGANGFFVPSTELLDGLTRRQAEAVVAAATLGYYREPRATTLAQVAARVGVGRASLEEHLRKAENKILTALVPFVSVRAASLRASRPRGTPFARINRHHGKKPRAAQTPRGPHEHSRR